MAFRIFTLPIRDSGEGEAQLNAFLGSHKILNVDRRWVEQGADSFWSFCVDYLPQSSSARSAEPQPRRQRSKDSIDYKDRLPPEQFAIFAKLRDLRKEIALAEAVPVYTVFTNEHLAKMVTQGVRTRPALEKIDGVGEARVNKYGPRFLERLSELLGPNQAVGQAVAPPRVP